MSKRYTVQQSQWSNHIHQKFIEQHNNLIPPVSKQWIVIDAATNGVAYFGSSKKDCVAFAKYWNSHEETR